MSARIGPVNLLLHLAVFASACVLAWTGKYEPAIFGLVFFRYYQWLQDRHDIYKEQKLVDKFGKRPV